jgi:hypothetical protein
MKKVFENILYLINNDKVLIDYTNVSLVIRGLVSSVATMSKVTSSLSLAAQEAWTEFMSTKESHTLVIFSMILFHTWIVVVSQVKKAVAFIIKNDHQTMDNIMNHPVPVSRFCHMIQCMFISPCFLE